MALMALMARSTETSKRRLQPQRLMAIAADARIADVTHVQHLPASWRTLYDLTRLDDGTWAMAMERISVLRAISAISAIRWGLY